jgi:small-conductance mechanosensitive channel
MTGLKDGNASNGSAPLGGREPFGGTLVDVLTQVPPEVRSAVGFVVVLVLGWYGSKFLVRIAGRTVAQRIRRPSVTRTVLRGIRLGALVVTLLVAAGFLGLRVGELFISVTVFTAVLGIILAPIAGSIINGLFVLADQPYEIGDMIEIADTGRTGFVEDITIRYTKIFTLDNTFIVIANSTIRDRDVVNYSAEDERTRLSLQLLVTYEGDLDAARDIMERAAKDVDEVITGGPDIRIGAARYPAAPTCYIDEYADSGVLLTLRYWGKRPYKLLTIRSKVNERVWAELADADDVEVAYPHQQLVFDQDSPVPTTEAAGGPGGRGGNGPTRGSDGEGAGEGLGR